MTGCPRTGTDERGDAYRCDLTRNHGGDCLDKARQAFWTLSHAGRFRITWSAR